MFWKPGHGKFVKVRVDEGKPGWKAGPDAPLGFKYVSPGLITTVNGTSAAEHAAAMGGTEGGHTDRWGLNGALSPPGLKALDLATAWEFTSRARRWHHGPSMATRRTPQPAKGQSRHIDRATFRPSEYGRVIQA